MQQWWEEKTEAVQDMSQFVLFPFRVCLIYFLPEKNGAKYNNYPKVVNKQKVDQAKGRNRAKRMAQTIGSQQQSAHKPPAQASRDAVSHKKMYPLVI
jgi:RNase P protein component